MRSTTETRFHYLASDFCDNYCRRPAEVKDQETLYELCEEDCPINRMRELVEEIEHEREKEPAEGESAGDGADGKEPGTAGTDGPVWPRPRGGQAGEGSYGAAQGSLFGGETECQTFGKLSYTKALALLALPAGEREAFVENHDVDAMSTRQLQKAIRERDAALQEAEGSALRIQELEEARDKIAEAYRAAEQEKGQLRDRLRELEEKGAEPAAADPAEIEAAVDAALADQAKENDRQMQELQEKLRSATIQEDELQKKLAKAKADLAEAKQKAKNAKAEGEEKYRSVADAAKAEAEQLRKKLAMSDPATAEFKAHFATAQAEIAACRQIAENAPPEVREKLQAAMVALAKTLEK